jgi:BASS family bile acid:Na+ symporter
VLAIGAGLILPGPGAALSGGVLPLFALLMLAVSLGFDLDAVRTALRQGKGLVASLALVYVPLCVGGYALGRLLFGAGPLAVGMALLGALPTDIAAPLFTALSLGNVALAAVFNAVDTAIAPLVLPGLLLLVTGVGVSMPVARLVGELALVVVLPTAAGVLVRTWLPSAVGWVVTSRAVAVASYLALVEVVVSGSAAALSEVGPYIGAVLVGALALNAAGYVLGRIAWRVSGARPADLPAYLFVLGLKEFSVAAAAVYAGGLDHEVLVPSLAAMALQIVTAAWLSRRLAAGRRAGDGR